MVYMAPFQVPHFEVNDLNTSIPTSSKSKGGAISSQIKQVHGMRMIDNIIIIWLMVLLMMAVILTALMVVIN